jgi:hypothetical protein
VAPATLTQHQKGWAERDTALLIDRRKRLADDMTGIVPILASTTETCSDGCVGGMSGLPTIVCAGPPLTTSGGHCHYLGGATEQGTDAVRRTVHAHAERGVDVIKVMASGGLLTSGTREAQSQFTPSELWAIVDEAHHLGLPVTAHGTPAIAGGERRRRPRARHALDPRGHREPRGSHRRDRGATPPDQRDRRLRPRTRRAARRGHIRPASTSRSQCRISAILP